ncbi:Zn-ribbon-containing protein [Paraferrimonas haliotis]|uniref:Zn-ribbon-containing protein n=1 Tax=Paraferrimonas haliotis TaxID=2013866 RepID=A0AA37TP83_9GAMM|nr:Zn-ribbon-containing protein [Paraferrimonas haliotis]GLS84343.1 Zn-ribbon-containing protein [Paraferrimonas haliotis]
MYIAHIQLACFRDAQLSELNWAITGFIDALRDNGQLLGREFPTQMVDACFTTRVVLPAKDSLNGIYDSPSVKHWRHTLNQVGLTTPRVKIDGIDLHSDHSDQCQQRNWQVLFTNYLSSCSPLRCGNDFAPIPLYTLPRLGEHDYRPILRWQQAWAALDELQIQGTYSAVESQALFELGSIDSELFAKGYAIAQSIERLSDTPTYYYLYRVGGESLSQEKQLTCPKCKSDWLLDQPLFDVFDFKCDACRLVSNLSWNLQGS